MTEVTSQDVIELPARKRVWPKLFDLGMFLAIGLVLAVKLREFWLANPLFTLGLYLWGSAALNSVMAMKPMAERPGFLDVLGPLIRVRARGSAWPTWFTRLIDADLAPGLVPVSEAYLEWDGPFLLLRDRRLPTPAITLGAGESAVPAKDWLKAQGIPLEGIDTFVS